MLRPCRVDGLIELSGVSVSFGSRAKDQKVEALRGVDLEVEAGRFVCIVGPSGCGKSTVLNMIAGLLRPTTGSVKYGGHEVAAVNTKTGYITQRDTLLPWRTLEDNIGLALEIEGQPKSRRAPQVAAMIDRVGLSGFERLYPSQLSGGMRKRATLARTLIYKPETLLMDEPFGAVDAILRVSLHAMLMELWERESLTIVFVTHDLDEALLLADEIVVFGRAPGQVRHLEKVPFARPRDPIDLPSDPAFSVLRRKLWSFMDQSESPGVRPAAFGAI